MAIPNTPTMYQCNLQIALILDLETAHLYINIYIYYSSGYKVRNY